MLNVKQILVAVDFSPSSACAFLEAARIAGRTGATLRAIHVIDADLIEEFERRLKLLGEDVRTAFIDDAKDRWKKFLGDHPAHATELTVVVGHRLQTVLDRVRKDSIDLLVLGTHGANGPDFGTGPLAVACARQANASILLVRPPHSGAFERIVACVDFSETSGLALEQASAIATHERAKLLAIHAFQSPWNQLNYTPSVLEPLADFAADYRRSIEERLVAFCAKFQPKDAPAAERHARDHASPGIAIAAFAREQHADLIVLGTRGADDARVIPVGSTAERLLQESPCSVLIVKPKHAS
jgi:nucleotide-binding universal stress UspA family protein